VLVVPPDDALAKLNKVSVSALAGLKFVGYERDIATRKASDRILREHGVKPQYTMEFDNIETIKRAVEIGQGVAIVPLSTVEHETTRGSLKMLEVAEGTFTRPLAIIYKRGRELSPAVRKFVEVLTSAKVHSPGTRTDKGDGGNGRSEARTERPDKSERQDKSDKSDRSEKADKGEKPDRVEKAERAERA